MPLWFSVLAQVSIIAYALLGGVFLAFSDFLMRSLGRVEGGAAAMRAINEDVFRIVFMALFLGMVPVSFGLAVGAWWLVETPWPFIAAAALYLAGVFCVTAAFNVPMNDALAALDPASPEGQSYWRTFYLPRWTGFNTLRTGACILAAVALLFGVVRQG